jgi:hypothetical protein
LRTIIIIFLALGVSISSAAEDKDSPEIRTLMTPEDFSEAGLDKLSESERAHLSEWVARYREGAIKGPPVPGKPSPKVAQDTTPTAASEGTSEATSETASESTGETTEEYPGGYRTQKEVKKDKKVKYQLVAKVISFRGWSGKSLFRLDNGQVWQQRMPGKLRYNGTDSTVTITQNLMGKFVLEHQGTGRAVGVKRID